MGGAPHLKHIKISTEREKKTQIIVNYYGLSAATTSGYGNATGWRLRYASSTLWYDSSPGNASHDALSASLCSPSRCQTTDAWDAWRYAPSIGDGHVISFRTSSNRFCGQYH